MRSLVFIATAALWCCISDGQTFGINEADLIDCVEYIICVTKNVQEYRKVISQYKPRAMEFAMGMLRDGLQWPEAANNDETWSDLPLRVCVLNEDKKNTLYNQLATGIADFWGKVCDEGDIPECDGIENCAKDFSKLLTGYLAKGLCGPAAKAKNALKLPSFG